MWKEKKDKRKTYWFWLRRNWLSLLQTGRQEML